MSSVLVDLVVFRHPRHYIRVESALDPANKITEKLKSLNTCSRKSNPCQLTSLYGTEWRKVTLAIEFSASFFQVAN